MFNPQDELRTLVKSNPAIESKVSLQKTDITKLSVDAIVNAANSRLVAGCGVDGAIHSAAGPDLQLECLALGGCTVGDAKITLGHRLPARYVIHTVGPLYEDAQTLANCYLRCLEVLVSFGLRSIAFCCISTGVYGYPHENAVHTALGTVRGWLEDEANMDKITQVIFSVFDKKNWDIYVNEFPKYFPSSSIGIMIKPQDELRTLVKANPAVESKVSLQQTDITKLTVDAVVNAANSRLVAGCGVDGAIHSAAGPDLQLECLSLGGCTVGDAKITRGYCLPARYIIHTVGPLYEDAQTLANCYLRCLEVLVSFGLRSIAFCCISTGVYGYPHENAVHTALGTVRGWLEKAANRDKIDQVIFSVFDKKNWEIYVSEFPRYFPSSSIERMHQRDQKSTFDQGSNRRELIQLDKSSEYSRSLSENKHQWSEMSQTCVQAEQSKPRNSHVNFTEEQINLRARENLSLALAGILPDLSINPNMLNHLVKIFQNDVDAVIYSITDSCAQGFIEKVSLEEFTEHFLNGQESICKKDLLIYAIQPSISQNCSAAQILNAVKQCNSTQQLNLFFQKTEIELKQPAQPPRSLANEENLLSYARNDLAKKLQSKESPKNPERDNLVVSLAPFLRGREEIGDGTLGYLSLRFGNTIESMVNFLLDPEEEDMIHMLELLEEQNAQLMHYHGNEPCSLKRSLVASAVLENLAAYYDVGLIIDAVIGSSSKEEMTNYLENATNKPKYFQTQYKHEHQF